MFSPKVGWLFSKLFLVLLDSSPERVTPAHTVWLRLQWNHQEINSVIFWVRCVFPFNSWLDFTEALNWALITSTRVPFMVMQVYNFKVKAKNRNPDTHLPIIYVQDIRNIVLWNKVQKGCFQIWKIFFEHNSAVCLNHSVGFFLHE